MTEDGGPIYPEAERHVRRGQFDEEAAVKQPALYVLGSLGWEEQACLQHEWDTGSSTEGRRTPREVILEPRLRAAFAELNPGLPLAAIEKAVESLKEDRRAMPPQEASKAFHGLLRGGVKVRVPDGKGGTVTETVRVIDWKSPRNNHFFIADEFIVQGELY